jgi:hypothetical protein
MVIRNESNANEEILDYVAYLLQRPFGDNSSLMCTVCITGIMEHGKGKIEIG